LKIDDFHLAYIGHPAFKKMGAKQAYSLATGLVFLPLCFFSINALLLSIIAIVNFRKRKKTNLKKFLRYLLVLLFVLILFQ
jgi:hypothetical protein